MAANAKQPPATTKRKPKKDTKPKVKRISSTVVELSEDGSGPTLHVKPEMHGDGLERFIHSKRFEALNTEDKHLLKTGSMQIKVPVDIAQVAENVRFWCKPEAGVYGKCYQLCILLPDGVAKVVETGQRFKPAENAQVLLDQTVNYSFTIKQAGNAQTSDNMTTKKAAPKKAAKKAAKGKPGKKGSGIIAKIREYAAKGLSNKEIVAKGFNATTVSIQAAAYRRELNAKKGSKKK